MDSRDDNEVAISSVGVRFFDMGEQSDDLDRFAES